MWPTILAEAAFDAQYRENRRRDWNPEQERCKGCYRRCMETEQFHSLRVEFEALQFECQAAPTVEQRLPLSDKITRVLNKAEAPSDDPIRELPVRAESVTQNKKRRPPLHDRLSLP